MRISIVFLFFYSLISFADDAGFYLNSDSEYCQSIKPINQSSECIRSIAGTNLRKDFEYLENFLEVTPKHTVESAANIMRLAFFERYAKPLRRRLILSNALGNNPRTFLDDFSSSFTKCDSYRNEMASVVEFSTGGLTIFKDDKEQAQYRDSLVRRYKIALLELHRLNLLKKKSDNKTEIEKAINQIYREYPTIKTMQAKHGKALPNVIVSRLTVKLDLFPTPRSAKITDQNINNILGLADDVIDTSKGENVKRANFYRLAYEKILNDDKVIEDHWLDQEIIENDVESTKKSIQFLGDICEMSACDIIDSSPSEFESILTKTTELNKHDAEAYICNHCGLGAKEKTFSDTQVVLSSLGALGAGVGCILSAPICIPAAIATAGAGYISFKNYEDSVANKEKQRVVATKRSIIADDEKDYDISIKELEARQKENTNSALLLMADTLLVGGEIVQAGKVTKSLVSNFVKGNKTINKAGTAAKLYRGSTLKDIPSEALEIYLKVSKNPEYIPTKKEMQILKRHKLIESFKQWKGTNKVVRGVNEKLAVLYRSKVRQGDQKFILSLLKTSSKALFPVYKSFQFNNRVRKILDKILLNPQYKMTQDEIIFLTKKKYLDDVKRFQDDAVIGLQSGFAKVEKARTVAGRAAWGVTLGAVGANLFVDEQITVKESFDEESELGMSRYDEKVELIFTSPMPHVSVRVGGLVYNYGVMKVQRYNLDDYKSTVGFGAGVSGNHIRIELNLTKEEKKKLIDYMEGDVGKVYPLALPFVDCISQTNKAIKAATGIDVPVVMDRSQALSIGYYNMLKLSGSERVGKVTFASSENPVVARAKESAVNIIDSLMFTKYAPAMLLTTPILDQKRLTIDPETGEFN